MLRRSSIGKFVKVHIAPQFPGFHMYDTTDLVRVRRPLLHGICFEQSPSSDLFRTWCFVDFLTDPRDSLALGFGERMRRPGHTLGQDPTRGKPAAEWTAKEKEAFLKAMEQSHRTESFALEPAEVGGERRLERRGQVVEVRAPVDDFPEVLALDRLQLVANRAQALGPTRSAPRVTA